jgi:hypothetical protein
MMCLHYGQTLLTKEFNPYRQTNLTQDRKPTTKKPACQQESRILSYFPEMLKRKKYGGYGAGRGFAEKKKEAAATGRQAGLSATSLYGRMPR